MVDAGLASGRPDAGQQQGSASLVGTFAELEARRRRILRHTAYTALALIATFALVLVPASLMLVPTLEPVPGSPTFDTLVALHSIVMPHLEEIGIAAVVAAIVWIGSALWAWWRFAWRPKREYLAEFKERVFGAVCRAHFPGMVYEPGGGISWQVLDQCGLFAFASDAYRSEDRFTGRSGATDVTFAEAVAQRKVTRGLGQNRETLYETYFRGIVFSADFHKHFHSVIRLLPTGGVGGRADGEQPAQLEDPRFAAVFDVWTTDHVDVRYVLSPSMMERLVALATRFRGLRARFEGGRLLLLLPTHRNRFEPSLYREASNGAQVAEFVADVRACLEVVDALDLNTRIWSKG